MTEIGMRPSVGPQGRDFVEVRSAEEILATLDERAELEDLPFMPESGLLRTETHGPQVAQKPCDTHQPHGHRRMTKPCTTGSRCDGSAHGGCENGMLPVLEGAMAASRVDPDDRGGRVGMPSGPERCRVLEINTQGPLSLTARFGIHVKPPRLFRAAPAPPAIEGSSAVRRQDLTRGETWVSLAVLRAFRRVCSNRLPDCEQGSTRGGCGFARACPGVSCKSGLQGRMPDRHLDLEPGRTRADQVHGGDPGDARSNRLNRGLGFDAELSRFCGRVTRVKSRASAVSTSTPGGCSR